MRDEYDIEKWAAAGSKTMGALSRFWNNDHDNMLHEYRMFTLATLVM